MAHKKMLELHASLNSQTVSSDSLCKIKDGWWV